MASASLHRGSVARGAHLGHLQSEHSTPLNISSFLPAQPCSRHFSSARWGERHQGPCYGKTALTSTQLQSEQCLILQAHGSQLRLPFQRRRAPVCAAFRWPWDNKDEDTDSTAEEISERVEQENGKKVVPAEETDVVVVGAGLAGLACARTLHNAGVPFRLLEVSVSNIEHLVIH
jgi:hypothetical protein